VRMVVFGATGCVGECKVSVRHAGVVRVRVHDESFVGRDVRVYE
jgi:hypothetical protein